MFKPTLESVISIDTDKELLHLYSMKSGDKNSINYFVVNYKARAFDKEFYEKIGNILKQYKENYPTASLHKVSLILPDSACLVDTVTVPFMQKSKMDSSLNVTLSNLYKNSAAIRFNRFILSQNKQQATYGIVGLRRDIISGLTDAFSQSQAGISNITYASAAATDGAAVLNPKLKNASYMLLDIKENSARIVFVVKGKTMGAYNLPFGYAVLSDSTVIPEDLLFDYPTADLAVLNAKERAKAKALTVSSDAKRTVDDDDEDDEEVSVFNTATAELPSFIHTDKKARKLPKYMLRETPESAEGFVCENFRLFVKWTLDVFASNTSITSLASIENVYVNLPERYGFVCAKANEEQAENKLKFVLLTENYGSDLVHKNLELYGGFYAKQYNKPNNFPVFKNLERYGNLFAKPSSEDVSKAHVGLFGKRDVTPDQPKESFISKLLHHNTEESDDGASIAEKAAVAKAEEKHSLFAKREKPDAAAGDAAEKHSLFSKLGKADKPEGADKAEKHSLFAKHEKPEKAPKAAEKAQKSDKGNKNSGKNDKSKKK